MDTADSLIDHGQEVLHDRLQAIHSFRSLQIERDAQIDDLQAYIHQLQEKNSWLEDRNMILEHCLEEKSIELDQAFNTIRSYEGRLQSSEDAIQELQIKRDAAIYESNKLLKVMDALNEDTMRTRKQLLEELNQCKEYIHNFHSICLTLNDAIDNCFGASLRHCSQDSIQLFYTKVIEIFTYYKSEKRLYIEELYVLCDSIIYLLSRFTNIHIQLKQEVKQTISVSRKAKTTIEELLSTTSQVSSISSSRQQHIDELLELVHLVWSDYPRLFRTRSLGYLDTVKSLPDGNTKTHHAVSFMHEICSVLTRELDNALSESQKEAAAPRHDETSTTHVPPSEVDESMQRSLESIHFEWEHIRAKQDSRQSLDRLSREKDELLREMKRLRQQLQGQDDEAFTTLHLHDS